MRSRPSLLALGGWAAFWLYWTAISCNAAVRELSIDTSQLFSGSGNCAWCHDRWRQALVDRQGQDVSIGGDWRGTMMAHSFKDPLWRARMEAEVQENPGLKSYIEDKCQTCHAPMARTQVHNRQNRPLAFAKAKRLPLAHDGVSCTLCHQIQPQGLGQGASYTGQYRIEGTREIFGPYEDIFPGPMRHHVDYEPKFGKHIQDSALCGTCHTLFTPILDTDGKTTGQFAEQTPYLEWRNSVHAQRGEQCQDCHMPRLDEPIKVSSRPPWLGAQQPFWRHQFTGGNAFMLALLADEAEAVAPNAEPGHFRRMIRQTKMQLRDKTARLQVDAQRHGNALLLKVEVENLAGHKFPTGFPYRRAWLHVKVADATGRTLFESGAADASGRIRGLKGDYELHHDTITRPDQVQIYEAVMGDAQGRATRSLLRAHAYLKDNRLPPRGFVREGPDHATTAPRGQVETDPNFNARGSGQDQVVYRLDIGEPAGLRVAEVALLYQTVPPEAVADLLASAGPAAKAFAQMYSRAAKEPETVQRVRIELGE